MLTNNHENHENCECILTNSAARQSFIETEFERGIWSAAINNETDKIEIFIGKGQTNKRDRSGYTALHYSARNGHIEVCKKLISAGGDVNATTNGGSTPLHRAAMMGHAEIVKLLLEANAKTDVKDESGQTALHRSAAANHLLASKYLIMCSANLKSMKDNKGRIPYELVSNSNSELKSLLLTD